MKKYVKFITLFISAMILCACEEGEREGMSASLEYRVLTVSTDHFNFRADGKDGGSFKVESENASWSVETPDAWIQMDTLKGTKSATVNVTVDRYTDMDAERKGIIVVKSTVPGWNFADTIKVTQSVSLPYANASEDKYEIAANGGEMIIPIDANLEWRASTNSEWVNLTKIDKSQLKLTVDPTTSTYTRTATVTLSSASNSSVGSFRVEQKSGTINISETEHLFSKEGGEFVLTIDANTNWTVEISNPTWISVSKDKGGAGSTTLTITADETSSSRSGHVYFKIGGSNVKTFYVRQQ